MRPRPLGVARSCSQSGNVAVLARGKLHFTCNLELVDSRPSQQILEFAGNPSQLNLAGNSTTRRRQKFGVRNLHGVRNLQGNPPIINSAAGQFEAQPLRPCAARPISTRVGGASDWSEARAHLPDSWRGSNALCPPASPLDPSGRHARGDTTSAAETRIWSTDWAAPKGPPALGWGRRHAWGDTSAAAVTRI